MKKTVLLCALAFVPLIHQRATLRSGKTGDVSFPDVFPVSQRKLIRVQTELNYKLPGEWLWVYFRLNDARSTDLFAVYKTLISRDCT